MSKLIQAKVFFTKLLCLTLFCGSIALAQSPTTTDVNSPSTENSAVVDSEIQTLEESYTQSGQSIFARALSSGTVVFAVLAILVLMSIFTWAILLAKWIHLAKLDRTSNDFIKSFWDSRSLNDLNSRLGDYPYSPVREVFRSGYSELVRSSHLKEQSSSLTTAVSAAVDNLNRSLQKSKLFEKRRLERFLSTLAICASAAPFIGLFGTVWGIMGAFEGIARTGSASLAAVAPGISEALIATAFGLAAAIPAVIGYNIFSGKIRGQLISIDGFTADFLNIVERYLVSDRKNQPSANQPPL